MALGILMYDVPVKDTSSYHKLRQVLRGALQLNYSCYLIDWDMREHFQKTISQLGAGVDCKLLELAVTKEEAYNLAASAFNAFTTKVISRLCNMLNKEKKVSSYAQAMLEEAAHHAAIFGLTNEFEEFEKSIKKYCEAKTLYRPKKKVTKIDQADLFDNAKGGQND